MGHTRSSGRTGARPRSRNDPGGEAFGCPEPELIQPELINPELIELGIVVVVVLFPVIILELSALD